MLFTSNLRKAVDQYRAPNSCQNSPSKVTLEQKRAQLLRRHTCASINAVEKLTVNSLIIPNNGLANSARKVSFREPFVEEDEDSDNEKVLKKLVLLIKLMLFFQSSIGPPSTAPPPLPSYAQPPSMPTNVYPVLPQNTFPGGSSSYHDDPWNDLPSQKPAVATYQSQPVPASLPNPASAPILPHQSLSATASTNQIQDDDFDDDWSDEDEEITVSFSAFF